MKRRNVIAEQRGQTMVEFALVLPVLCMILLGIVQFGVVFNDYITLTDAARAGARKAVVSRHLSNASAIAEAAVRASATDLDSAKLSVDVSVNPRWERGADVTVTASYPYEITLLGLVTFKDGELTSTTTERVE